MKRLVSVLSSLGLLLSGLAVSSPARAIPPACTLSGAGTQADPILIESAQDLSDYRDCQGSGVFAKLTQSIELVGNWDPFPIEGTFDGDFFSISNLVSSGGLFSVLNSATVKNLLLTAPVTLGSFSDSVARGALAQEAIGSSVIHTVAVASPQVTSKRAAGLIGEIREGTTLENIFIHDANIRGSEIAAGVAVRWLPTSDVVFDRIAVTGEVALIEEANTTSVLAAGLIGSIETGPLVTTATVARSSFDGTLRTGKSQSGHDHKIGGFAAQVQKSVATNPTLQIDNSYVVTTIQFPQASQNLNLLSGAGFVAGSDVDVDIVNSFASFDASDFILQDQSLPLILSSLGGAGSVSSVYYESDRSGGLNVTAPTGADKTASALRTLSTFVGWDISSTLADGLSQQTTWILDPQVGHGFPSLSWQVATQFSPVANDGRCQLIGEGSSQVPFLVGTVPDFMEMTSGDCADGISTTHFRLYQDLRLWGGDWSGQDFGFVSGPLTILDGDGYRISNLTIDSVSGTEGLFKHLYNVNISDLALIAGDLICVDQAAQGNCELGALAGVMSASMVEDVQIILRGDLRSNQSNPAKFGHVGGLSGIIVDSVVLRTFVAAMPMRGIYGDWVGGIAGTAFNLTMDTVEFNEGILEGFIGAGGLVGAMGSDEVTPITGSSVVGATIYGEPGAIGAIAGIVVDHSEFFIEDLHSYAQVIHNSDNFYTELIGLLPPNAQVEASYFILANVVTVPDGSGGSFIKNDAPFDALRLLTVQNVERYVPGTVELTAQDRLVGWSVTRIASMNSLPVQQDTRWVLTLDQGLLFSRDIFNNLAAVSREGAQIQVAMTPAGLEMTLRDEGFYPIDRLDLYTLRVVNAAGTVLYFDIYSRAELAAGVVRTYPELVSGESYTFKVETYDNLGLSQMTIPFNYGYSVPDPCNPGEFSSTGFAPCTQAPAGSFVASTRATSAQPCPAGFTSDVGATACYPVSPGGFSGPRVDPMLESVWPGSAVTLTGSGLSAVTKVSVAGIELEWVSYSDSAIEIKIPADLENGLYDLVLNSTAGAITLQGFLQVIRETRLITEPVFSIKRTGDRVRIFAIGIIDAGKVQFYLNGQEIAWVNALEDTDPKLRSSTRGAYLVRNKALESGRNVIEILLDGDRVRRVIYSG